MVEMSTEDRESGTPHRSARKDSGTWDVRQLNEVQRMWDHVNNVEKEVEQMENAVTGLRYALFGVEEVPHSGLVHRIEGIRREIRGVRRGILGLISTVMAAVIVQIILHYT